MSYCKANPCCADPFFCEVPIPQHKTGLYWLNDPNWKEKAKKEKESKDWDHRTSKETKSQIDLYPWEKAPDDWR